ncbi:hypothetical protein LPTSP4_09430 [Leptospira ryugenii]|uniref:Uncharacterized protein n=1 Tax=Leptospira ryugenii TaxID=1917863 RepID=A0A2P2DXX3_9LEPT|nr:hypothetical protein LPTSP4_09430 [Leptospira ryugenii]
MGQLIGYECPNCNYEFDKFDGYGFVSVLETYHCSRCMELVDVLVGIRGKKFTEEMALEHNKRYPLEKENFFKCPNCRVKKTLSPWNLQTKPCPKCQTKMNQNGKIGNWD